ncbi:MAG: hypothetical protein QNJ63_30190 [Calothrix sp. MO_192.B10]|nr:hypothetical protein [Calothrix sp. MO_192.B10]
MIKFVLWSICTLAWFFVFPLFWFLTGHTVFIWMLGQSKWISQIGLWLTRIGVLLVAKISTESAIALAMMTLLPIIVSGYLCKHYGAKALIPFAALTIMLVPIGLVYGRIDKQGTINENLYSAVQRGDLRQCRGLLLILVRRYHQYGFFTDGKDLIRTGVDPNIQDSRGMTPLMAVVDNPLYVQQLVQSGADINITNNEGKTALDLATSYPETQQILKQICKS